MCIWAWVRYEKYFVFEYLKYIFVVFELTMYLNTSYYKEESLCIVFKYILKVFVLAQILSNTLLTRISLYS